LFGGEKGLGKELLSKIYELAVCPIEENMDRIYKWMDWDNGEMKRNSEK
jgi:hypothetical protein